MPSPLPQKKVTLEYKATLPKLFLTPKTFDCLPSKKLLYTILIAYLQ